MKRPIPLLAALVWIPSAAFAAHGTYEVPIREELWPYASFALPGIDASEGVGGAVRVEYALPLLLTGVENRIKITGKFGPEGEGVLEGSGATASCRREDARIRCSVRYGRLSLNQDRLAERIAVLEPDEPARAKRLEVAMTFLDDPIGILVHGYGQ